MKEHFTPIQGWMNDPNGTIIIDGEYHLFYQHNPSDIKWGPMHWGHATSCDGINWTHHDIALSPDEFGYAFSGCCVLDKNNLSGLGIENRPALVAIFTRHNPDSEEQQQFLYYSLSYDQFIPYENNPIISNRNDSPHYKKDFRDPKCFENPILGGYSMVMAAGSLIEFYHSANLLEWRKTGEFALATAGLSGIVECPDCFAVPYIDGIKWVLSFSLCGNDGPNIMPYFIGSFDGYSFIADTPLRDVNQMDYGPDNYAQISFANSDKVQMIGWGENWTYAQNTPAEYYRGKMTCIRRVSIIESPNGEKLSFVPIVGYEAVKKTINSGDIVTITTEGGGSIIISLTESLIKVSRKNAVKKKFHKCFEELPYLEFTAERNFTGPCDLTILHDENYYEIFADKGTIVFSISSY